MPHRTAVNYCFGFSSGATVGAVWEFLTRPTTVSAVLAAASGIASALSWLVARRQDLQRAAIELKREQREAERAEALADVLNELKIAKARSEMPPGPRP